MSIMQPLTEEEAAYQTHLMPQHPVVCLLPRDEKVEGSR
jgi:hypothetical protein